MEGLLFLLLPLLLLLLAVMEEFSRHHKPAAAAVAVWLAHREELFNLIDCPPATDRCEQKHMHMRKPAAVVVARRYSCP
jgi:hypothetical protein